MDELKEWWWVSNGTAAWHLMGAQYKLVTGFPCFVSLWPTELLSDKHYCRKETRKLMLLCIIVLLVVNNAIKISTFQTDASGTVNMICESVKSVNL